MQQVSLWFRLIYIRTIISKSLIIFYSIIAHNKIRYTLPFIITLIVMGFILFSNYFSVIIHLKLHGTFRITNQDNRLRHKSVHFDGQKGHKNEE